MSFFNHCVFHFHKMISTFSGVEPKLPWSCGDKGFKNDSSCVYCTDIHLNHIFL